MEAPSLIGLGIGFAAIGLVFTLLSKFKPDMAPFRKYTQEQFCRTQGVLAMCIVFGLLLILDGAMLLLGLQGDDNPAATMAGAGAGLAVIGFVLYLLSVHKPNMGIFKRDQGKKRWQAQGTYLGLGVFGLIYFLLGLMGKRWAL